MTTTMLGGSSGAAHPADAAASGNGERRGGGVGEGGRAGDGAAEARNGVVEGVGTTASGWHATRSSATTTPSVPARMDALMSRPSSWPTESDITEAGSAPRGHPGSKREYGVRAVGDQ